MSIYRGNELAVRHWSLNNSADWTLGIVLPAGQGHDAPQWGKPTSRQIRTPGTQVRYSLMGHI